MAQENSIPQFVMTDNSNELEDESDYILEPNRSSGTTDAVDVDHGSEFHLDDILDAVGGYGRYQMIIHFICMVALTGEVVQTLSVVFMGLPSPLITDTNNTNLSVQDPCKIPKDQRLYLDSDSFSFVVEFDLTCDRAWLAQMVTSVYFAGSMIGSLVFGWTSDNYGRRRTLLYIYVAFLIIGSFSSLSSNVWLLILLRFATGVFTAPAQGLLASLLAEVVPARHRSNVVVTTFMLLPVALTLLSIIAYLIPNWKIISLISTAPYFAILPILAMLPESLSWLFIKGRTIEAKKILKKISLWNKRPLVTNMVNQRPRKVLNERKTNMFHLFCTKDLAINTIVLGIGFFSVATGYYGMIIGCGNLSKDSSVYINFFLSSIVELPAYFAICYALQKYGRKWPNIVGLAMGAICCLVLTVMPDFDAWSIARVSIGVLGRCFVTVTFLSITPWTIELYPTVIRSQAIGFGYFLSRLGTLVYPWMIGGMKYVHPGGSWALLGFFLGVASLLMMILSEAKDQSLPNFIPGMEMSNDMMKDDKESGKDTKIGGSHKEKLIAFI